MNILEKSIVGEIELSVGDTWDIGNGVSIILTDLFEIDGQIYVATVMDGHSMMSVRINKDSEESITPNRYINNAEIWVKKNIHLFNK